MELKDTVELMCSEDYKKRFVAEYLQTRIRYEKLKYMTKAWDKGELKFKPVCSRGTYEVQLKAMGDYLTVLELRAFREKIELPKFEGIKIEKKKTTEETEKVEEDKKTKDDKDDKDDNDILNDMLFKLFILSMLS